MSLTFHQNYSLKSLNTFGIDANAREFVSVENVEQFIELTNSMDLTKEKHLILGGGSNMLILDDFDGLIIQNKISGFEKVKEDDNHVWVKSGGGENWHEFVLKTIENNWGGLENLSLIPGCVGASPIQNIGAYGVEIKDTFDSLTAIHLKSGTIRTFEKHDCQFGYRDSVFKGIHKGEYFIADVTFKLSKQPSFNTSYGAIEKQLAANGVKNLSLKAISDAVIQIRQSKLPDPNEIGNSGSFFKNPIISEEQFKGLEQRFPKVVNYPVKNGVKLAAGWLIEQAGWKGFTRDEYGVHEKQALVLVNYGNAKGQDIFNLSSEIIASVKEKFGVELEREVNIIC